MRTPRRACALAAALLLVVGAPSPSLAAPMASGQDSRDTGHLPQFNFTAVEVRPGQGGALTVTVTNRYNQQIYSLIVEFDFQVGGEWRHARPVSEISQPPQFDRSSLEPPRDLGPGQSITLSAPFTTSAGTPEGVYLVTVVARFSYLDSTNITRGATVKSLGAIAQQGNQSLVDMDNYSATLEALSIDGVAPDTAILVDSHSGEALFWTAAVAGVVVVAAGFALARHVAGRRPAPPARRKRG